MSEGDRIAYVETIPTGRNAWRTGWEWWERNRARMYAEPSAPLPEGPDAWPLLSGSLCGRHRNLAAHLRDTDPLAHDDPTSRLWVRVMRRANPELLHLLPDDPGRMADRILQEADPTLIDDEERYDAAWREMKAIIEPHLDMMDGPDPGGSARLAMRVMEAEYGG